MAFTLQRLNIVRAVERSASVISLLGTLFIVVTFLRFKSFRKPINRLVFFASFGNIMANIATLISIAGIDAGEQSSLCLFQAFNIQMFIPADSLWTLCMALNVYLTFFKCYDARALRALEKWYLLLCYGLPFIPALAFLVTSLTSSASIYGDARLWCWITARWDWMRIAFFYGPVWVIIFLTTAIYVITGKEIFRQRALLRSFSRNPQLSPLPNLQNPFTSSGLTVKKVTEIHVTSEWARPRTPPRIAEEVVPAGVQSPSGLRRFNAPAPLPLSSLDRSRSRSPVNLEAEDANVVCPSPTSHCTVTVSTGNLEIPSPLPRTATRMSTGMKEHQATMRANTAAWGYAKVAMLMFFAMIIVWVPSTVNRVYQLAAPDQPLFVLNVLAALVLPLQGFWNFTVYVATTWKQCRDVFGLKGHNMPVIDSLRRRMTKLKSRHARRPLPVIDVGHHDDDKAYNSNYNSHYNVNELASRRQVDEEAHIQHSPILQSTWLPGIDELPKFDIDNDSKLSSPVRSLASLR